MEKDMEILNLSLSIGTYFFKKQDHSLKNTPKISRKP